VLTHESRRLPSWLIFNVRPMKRAILALFVLVLACGTSCAERPSDTDGMGLTQAQLAGKFGFPLRVFTLPASAQGGPGVLFWVYYERARPGKIEERQFVFQGSALKVCSTPVEFSPSRFLSLERDPDFQQIFRYNAQHGL